MRNDSVQLFDLGAFDGLRRRGLFDRGFLFTETNQQVFMFFRSQLADGGDAEFFRPEGLVYHHFAESCAYAPGPRNKAQIQARSQAKCPSRQGHVVGSAPRPGYDEIGVVQYLIVSDSPSEDAIRVPGERVARRPFNAVRRVGTTP